MKWFRDRTCIPARDYANQLGISLEETVGRIKTHEYYGEFRNGEWFVEPPRSVRSERDRVFAIVGTFLIAALVHTGLYLWRHNFEPTAWLNLVKPLSIYIIIALVLYILPKIHQLTDKGE